MKKVLKIKCFADIAEVKTKMMEALLGIIKKGFDNFLKNRKKVDKHKLQKLQTKLSSMNNTLKTIES